MASTEMRCERDNVLAGGVSNLATRMENLPGLPVRGTLC